MNSFWDNQYDNFKDRHYAALFWSTLMALIGLLALGVIIAAVLSGVGMQQYFQKALPAIGILGLAWVFLKSRQAQMRSRERLTHDPLSRDELRVARSKLRNGMKPIQRPAPRVPDTNLKY
jgi:5-bromo-4-chloroindolyl phosphate hydrolysis protein